MNYNIKNRFIVFGGVAVALFVVLLVQLIQLMLVRGAGLAAEASKLEVNTISISGARGSILDRNGLPLAYDQKAFNVQFYRDPTKNTEVDRAYYTSIIIETIGIVERNGGSTIDTFAVFLDEDTGEYYFDFGITEEGFVERREENWRSNMYVGTERTPEEIYLFLRNRYQIPAEMNYEEARKVLSIWQDVQLSSWVAYKPVDVAYNVSIQAVAEISTHRAELEGMSIEDSTVRIYPRKTVAAHIIGYQGRIDDKGWGTKDEPGIYRELGYSVDDSVGVTGIEASMEQYLTGNSLERQGRQEVEVDNYKVVQNVLSSTEPMQGHNVMLTLDIPMQLALEESLAKNIPVIKAEQLSIYEEKKDVPKDKGGYLDKIEDINDVRLAEAGAAVVIDVHSGDVLAMGSYPSFDLNLFVGGMPKDVYDSLTKGEAEITAPLFNKAVASRVTPGSIFKMVTGMGGLVEGVITLNTRIDDESPWTENVRVGSRAPRCWQRDISKHKDQTIVEGLRNSCNYFFFVVADGLGITRLAQWGEKFGLTSSTGIELPEEAVGQIGGQQILFDPNNDLDKQNSFMPGIVKRAILRVIEDIEEVREVEYDEDLKEKTAEELVYLAGINWTHDVNDNNILKDENGFSMGDHVRSILADNLRVPEAASRANGWSNQIGTYIDELRWTPIMTIQSGMGQGYIQVTPIAVARYVAALVNGGTVYETHILDKIVAQDGTVVLDKQPVVYDTIDAPESYFDAIKQGMKEVVSGEDGTARKFFENFEYRLEIGGKTGTAQVSDIDLENNSWFVSFAPYDDPEIAVVVFVPNGYSGGMSIAVARDIIGYYMDQKKVVAEQTMPDAGSLVAPKATDNEDSE